MNLINATAVVILLMSMSAVTANSALAATTGPANGYLIGNQFFSSSAVAASSTLLQDVNADLSASASAFELELNGYFVNYNQFLSTNPMSGGVSVVVALTNFAVAHPISLPAIINEINANGEDTQITFPNQSVPDISAISAVFDGVLETNITATVVSAVTSVQINDTNTGTALLTAIPNSGAIHVSVIGAKAGDTLTFTPYIGTTAEQSVSALVTTPAQTSPVVAVNNVNVTNGSAVVTFASALTTTPSVSDFAVTESVNGGETINITPRAVSMNSAMTQATLTLPTVSPTVVSQSVIYELSYDGGSTVSSNALNIAALPSITAVSAAYDGTLETGVTATVDPAITSIQIKDSTTGKLLITATPSEGVLQVNVVGANTGDTLILTPYVGSAAGQSVSVVVTAVATTQTSLGLYGDPLQNSATNDSTMWSRASNDFYLSVQTENPMDTGSGAPILQAIPGQTLYLFAYEDSHNIPNSDTTWSVNSSDATVVPGSSNWTRDSDGLDVAQANFTAAKPGVYTVQAETNGVYSIPLVITVGLGQLTYHNIAEPAYSTGIEPITAGIPAVTTINGNTTMFSVGNPSTNGWVPVFGTTTSGTGYVTVVFGNCVSPTSNGWTYAVPVNSDGTFGAMLRSPVSGNTNVMVTAHYNQILTDATNGIRTSLKEAPVTINGTALSQSRLDLLASSQMDFNLSPQFSQAASILAENSPSINTAIQAINNFTSDSLVYNSNELNVGGYYYEDALTAWNSGTGVCEDYAELEAALFRSIGIPAETVQGVVTDFASTSDDAHEWDQVWNGTNWIITDPTWSSNDTSADSMIINQFTDNSADLMSSHTASPGLTGTAFVRRGKLVGAYGLSAVPPVN